MKLGLLTKIVLAMIGFGLLPMLLLGIVSVGLVRDMGQETASVTAEALTREAEIGMSRVVAGAASRIDEFFLEAQVDLASLSEGVRQNYLRPELSSLEYSGPSFAYWASSDWPEHTRKAAIQGLLNGTVRDPRYNELRRILSPENVALLNSSLSVLASDYEVMNQAPEDDADFTPRFLISKELFFDLRTVGNALQGSANPFLLNDFLYNYLDQEGQRRVRSTLHLLSTGAPLVDSHASYSNFRLGFWGDRERGVEAIYAGDNRPFHPAAYGLGNCYYCKSPIALRQTGGDSAVWQNSILDPENKVSVVIAPVLTEAENPESELIGFVELWMDWATLSENVVTTQYGERGYMFLLDGSGNFMAHPDPELLNTPMTELGDSGLDLLFQEMVSNASGARVAPFGGEESYVGYARIPTTGWYAGLVVPINELGMVATSIEAQISNRSRRVQAVLLSAVGGVPVLIITVLLLFAARAVVHPLKRTSAKLQEIAVGGGDLTERLEASSRDEIGELSNSFNSFVGTLDGLVRGVKNSSQDALEVRDRLMENARSSESALEGIIRSIGEIRAETASLSDGAESTTTNVEAILSRIDDLAKLIGEQASAVQESSASTEEMVRSITNVAQVSGAKSEAASELVATTRAGSDRVHETNRSISEISTGIDTILEAIEIINNVAEQTNLLAMNAAIEAAHAGEAGRGFSVVAEEIRKLSESTGESVESISTVLRRQVDTIKKAMEESRQSGEAFDKISSEVGDFASVMQEISGSMSELSTGAQEVLTATSALSEITVKVQDGSEDMQRGGREVLDSVQSFRDAGNRVDRSIQDIAERGESIRQLVTEVGALSRRVGYAMQQIQDGMDSFRTSSSDTNGSVEVFASEVEDELPIEDEQYRE